MEYKGDIEGFPKPVVDMMRRYQVEQGNKDDITVFERNRCARAYDGGYDWDATPEGWDFHSDVVGNRDFDKFFEKYPELKENESTVIHKQIDLEQRMYEVVNDFISRLQEENKNNPLKTQIGGSHYKDFAIQPVEFITKNNLSFLEGCVIKRICRYKAKNGIEDLQKAKHEIDLIIELLKNE